ncbi:MAG: hypothetical protein K0B08_09505 [Bacteroidales bacterium]|nr:hypothetical protein [Bacteroidales bacterium]
MRKLLLIILLSGGWGVMAQVGVHTDFPHASAAMDIQATDKGLLIPRVVLTGDLNNPNPVSAPALGLMVFNDGANQPHGFYYWNGSQWVAVGGGSAGSDFWSLYGNAGTQPASNFVGTTDARDLAFRTGNQERMRVMQGGQVVIGSTAPYYVEDLFTVIGNSSQNSAINAYSPVTGMHSEGGVFGMISLANAADGYGVYGQNLSSNGYGMTAVGSNKSPTLLTNRSFGLSATGNDGILAYGATATGNGIIAVGSMGDTAFTSPDGSGGAFTGFHGVYARARNTAGTGIIASGNYLETYTLGGGSGGAFTGNVVGVAGWATSTTSGYGGYFSGNHGAYIKAMNSSAGNGIIAMGNGGSGSLLGQGGGGTFTGYHGSYSRGTNSAGIGIIGVGSNLTAYPAPDNGSGGSFYGYHGLVSKGGDPTAGTGVIGAGNDIPTSTIVTLTTGSGGAFTGYHGAFGKGVNIAGGTGIIGLGNNLSSYNVYSSGSGGAFTGIQAGAVGYATNTTTGTGVIGAGNNLDPITHASGSGGAFTGFDFGVCGYSTNTSTTSGTIRAGGYFETADGRYAYVAVYNQSSQNNRKIIGSAGVSTIVKNTQGELITLTCPEAPEELFMDFGIGQLVDGFAHIPIDPDLSININVSENHPLKVFITAEGECNGMYVTNKSSTGFDVKELQGGRSNVAFSWQIVATRADEEFTGRDGIARVSISSDRFPPAPGPLESVTQATRTAPVVSEVNEGNIIEIKDEFEVKVMEPVIETIKRLPETVPSEMKKMND